MFKWTTLVGTALACCLTMTAVNAGPDMGCLPPPLRQDYLKKTVRVEIKGKLAHVRTLSQVWMRFPGPSSEMVDLWQITVGGKTYTLDLGPTLQYARDRGRSLIAMPPWMDIQWQAEQLAGKTVIVTGTLDGTTVHVTALKADDEFVKETTEVEARGHLSATYLETFKAGRFGNPDFVVPVAAWNFVVGGKTYNLAFATAELEQLARKLDDKAVVLTGDLDKDTITVKTLKAAE
jgi:hypothetical protein